jgi:hypothetical protein
MTFTLFYLFEADEYFINISTVIVTGLEPVKDSCREDYK